jgi:hypothetical protein
LISAQTRGNSNAVTVTFSADVTEASATNAANYSVNNGVSVSNVVMLESGKVRLFTSLIGTEPEWNPSRSWLSSLNGRLQVPTTFVAGDFFVEAEDFDYGGGQHMLGTDTMPYFGDASLPISMFEGCRV